LGKIFLSKVLLVQFLVRVDVRQGISPFEGNRAGLELY
jgi:hypothetical protein